MKRKLLPYLAFGVIALIPLTTVWLVGSASGLRFLAGVLETRIPVVLDQPAGSLWGGVSVRSLHYEDDATGIEVENLFLRIAWACALRSTVCVPEAAADSVALEFSGEETSSSPLEAPLPWPALLLDIEMLTVGELSLTTDGVSERVTDLRLSGELGARRALVTELSGTHRLADFQSGGSLNVNGAWEITGEAAIDSDVTADWPTSLDNSYVAHFSGDLSKLEGVVEASDSSLTLTLALDQIRSEEILAKGSLEGHASVIPSLEGYAHIVPTGPLGFESRLTDRENLEIAVRQQISGLAASPQWLSVGLKQSDAVWVLTQSSLGNPEQPLISASGILGTLETIAPELLLSANELPVPLASGESPLTVSGTAELAFSSADPLGSFAVVTSGLSVWEGETHWELSGELRASDVAILPVGTLSGARDALPFSYERSSVSGAPAILDLPQGLPGEELKIVALRARITPGDVTELTLTAQGDLRGDLNLALEQTDTGADFHLEPFVLYLRDEAVRSSDAIGGRWHADESLINLESFCLQWRANTACADNAALGESGELDLAVEIDESLQGAVSEKPFSFEAKGAGALRLAWQDGALEESDFNVGFDVLSLDPYLSEGTASPLQWEHAKARGEIRQDSMHVTVDLQSQRLGNVHLDLEEARDLLAGTLRADGLDLASLDDLLPEWSLRNGRIAADLTVGGSRQSPEILGQLVLDGGAARLPDVDTELSELHVVLDATGQEFTLDAEAMLGGAPLSVTGICCDGDTLKADIKGSKNQLRLPTVGVEASVSPDVELLLTRNSVSVGGQVTVHGGVFEHLGPGDEAVEISDDFYRIDVPRETPRRFDVFLDLRALIEPRFTLRSKEIEATLGGDLSVNLQPTAAPALYGDLQVLGGELRAYGQVLRLTEGSVGFVGDPVNPALNLSAERRIRAEDLRVGFHVRGSLEEPVFEIFSDPVRSERDTLSYLLRGRGPDAGASVDGTAMALSLGASAINQSGALDSLNAIPGLSGVSLGAEGSDDDMAATISAYVGERLYLSYGVGIYEPVNALTARLYLRSRLWLEVVSRLESSFDLYYRFDID